jgi:hypothetical protein
VLLNVADVGYGAAMLQMPEPAYLADERESLEAMLDEQRALVLWKLDGIAEADAAVAPVPSGVTVLGVVKHLAWVERDFFAGDVAGREIDPPWSASDPDADWRIDPGETVESVTRFYADAVAESREILADRRLDDVVELGGEEPRSIRWIVLHMIEETARHLGHMDILRELVDGSTGYVPQR